MSKLWESAQQSTLSQWMMEFTVGNDYLLDMKLLPHDVKASRAHAHGLHLIGVLSETELAALNDCLDNLLEKYEQGDFVIAPEQEDCHTAIEEYLTTQLGATGQKIHTGRSRNDQVLTALRLYEVEQINQVVKQSLLLAGQLLAFARTHEFVPMPGYTHSQPAMLSSVGMWSGSFAEMLNNSINLLLSIQEMINQCPLGSAAGYGVSLPLEREKVSDMLGFKAPISISMTAQHSRGKWESTIVHGLSTVTETLSHFANDLIHFSSLDYQFFSVDETLTTGSSIMPQKKNLDIAEIVRGKHKQVVSHQFFLSQLITNLHSGYHRDLQLTKEAVMNSFETCLELLHATGEIMSGLKVNEEKLIGKIYAEMFAADQANEMAMSGIPFREAYQQVKSKLDSISEVDIYKKLKDSSHLGSTGNLGLEVIERNVNHTSLYLEMKQYKVD